MKREISAGVIVYRIQEDSLFYLILHYRHGHWDFPKGKLETGETLLEAAQRELYEETKIEAKIKSGFSFAYDYFFMNSFHEEVHKVVTYFIGLTTTEKITLSDEHCNFSWLPFEEALKKLSFDNSKSSLIAAQRFIEFF